MDGAVLEGEASIGRQTGESPSHERALRVDFLGPPGVGKSTLCQAVLSDGDREYRETAPNAKWVSISQARAMARQRVFGHLVPVMPITERIMSFLRLLRHGAKSFLFDGHLLPFPTNPISCVEEGLLTRFLEDSHSCFEALAEQWFDPDMVMPSKALRYSELLAWTKDWLFLTSQCGNVRILADNSRFTRGFAELLSNADCPERRSLAEDYLSSAMAPDGVIHLDGDPDLVLSRIHQREQTRNWRNEAHLELSDRQLINYTSRRNRINSTAVEFFRSRGVAVVSLEASMSLNENTKKVREFLDSAPFVRPGIDS